MTTLGCEVSARRALDWSVACTEWLTAMGQWSRASLARAQSLRVRGSPKMTSPQETGLLSMSLNAKHPLRKRPESPLSPIAALSASLPSIAAPLKVPSSRESKDSSARLDDILSPLAGLPKAVSRPAGHARRISAGAVEASPRVEALAASAKLRRAKWASSRDLSSGLGPSGALVRGGRAYR